MMGIDLEHQRAVLIAYLKAKVELADWHGVSDAANDLRVLEAQMEAIALSPKRDALRSAPA